MLVLVLLGYAVVAGGVVVSNLPLDSLLADPPIVALGVPTVVAIVALLAMETYVS